MSTTLSQIDRNANLAARLLALDLAHTTTVAGRVVTRWHNGYEIGTYLRGPLLTLEQATNALLRGG